MVLGATIYGSDWCLQCGRIEERVGDVTAIMQMHRKNPVNTRVVEKKTKIYNTGIRHNFEIWGCDMVWQLAV